MDRNEIITNNGSSIVIYTSEDGSTQLDVKFKDETVWLTIEQMSQLFDRDRTVINRHIRNVFKEGELTESLVCAKFTHTKEYGRREGFVQTKEVSYYNLDVIISVGYRVHSQQGVKFRIWATKVLKEYLTQGYVVNQKRLEHYNELKEIVTLMIAESRTEEKDIMVKVVVNLINKENE